MAQNSTYIFETSQFLTNDALKKFNIPIVKEGDVLLSFKLTVGRTAIAGANMVTNEAIACFKAILNIEIICFVIYKDAIFYLTEIIPVL